MVNKKAAFWPLCSCWDSVGPHKFHSCALTRTANEPQEGTLFEQRLQRFKRRVTMKFATLSRHA